MAEQVAIVRCANYEPSEVESAVGQCFDHFGGVDAFVKPGASVLLKVNMSGGFPPDRAVTTHPAIVEAVGKMLRNAGAEVWIGDSSVDIFANVDRAYEITGFRDVAERIGARLVNFEKEGTAELTAPSGRKLYVARAAVEADLVISLPKLKTHVLTGYTGAMKNLFGLQPGRTKTAQHRQHPSVREFVKVIVDLVEAVRPAFTIVDGVVAMEGDGPTSGSPRSVGLLLAARSPAALDVVGAALIGYEPIELPLLAEAISRGLAPADPREVQLVGEPFDEVRVPDFEHPSTASAGVERLVARVLGFARPLLEVRPHIDESLCRRCKLCEKICPVGAIEIGEPSTIDHGRCIRCFCCHEICPYGAMQARAPWFRRVAHAVFGAAHGDEK